MHLPAPLRAAVGLVATAADEAKHLPQRAIELPMSAVGTALQLSLRAQQHYAALTARGDELLNRSRPTAEPPAWATFDDPVADEDLRRAAEIGDLLDAVAGAAHDSGHDAAHDSGHDAAHDSGHDAAHDSADDADAADVIPLRGEKTISRPRTGAPSRFDEAGD